MKCPCCQAENPPGTRFCGQCAAPLAPGCPSCGAANPAENKFCGQCAAPLDQRVRPRLAAPELYTPRHLADRILMSKASLEGERKQVTVLFADLKGSMELLADRDPEEARKILDPVLEHMMEAVHRYEGTVNQVMGDGIMALFGAPIAHEDHAVRACYAALTMQERVRRYAEEARRMAGVSIEIRVGLNSGEVVVRSIGSDLRMDYTAVGQTTHLAARMEQLAIMGATFMTAATLRIAEGFIAVKPLGPVNVKGLAEPVEVYQLTAAGAARTRLHAAAARGLGRFVGRDPELEQLRRALEQAGTGRGQIVAVVGEPGVGKSRLFYEFTRSHRAKGWLVLESGAASYAKVASYSAVSDLLRAYFKIGGSDGQREIREKVTGKLFALDQVLQSTLPAVLSLLDVSTGDSSWESLEPRDRRQRTLDAVTRLLMHESKIQPLVVVFEDLQWIDGETQAVLDAVVESLPAAPIILLLNYRPEYSHGWGSKTFYSQLRLDPLPPEGAGRPPARPARCGPGHRAPQADVDRAGGGQPTVPRGVRPRSRRDRGPRGRRRGVSAGQAGRGCRGAGDRAGDPGRPYRPAARGGEASPACGVRGGKGCPPRAAPRRGRPRRAGPPAPARAPHGGRVPLRDKPLPRFRVHVQARVDTRSRLRQPASRAAPRSPRADRRGHRAAPCRPPP